MRVLLLLLCACGRVGFDPQGQPALDDSGAEGITGDGSDITGDGTSGSCTPPGNGSTFPGGFPCTNWGAMPNAQNTGLAENGALAVTPNANTAGAQGGCTKTNVPFGAGGAIVEVSAVLAGANTITAIQLGDGTTALSMVVQNNLLLAYDAGGMRGMIAYSATAARFWRIRPASPIVFEYGDGTRWTQLATSAQTPQATYTIQVLAGETTAVAAPGTARFESVNVCPP